MVRDAIKRYVEAAQSLTEVPRERAERVARRLALGGLIDASQIRGVASDLVERSRENRRKVAELVAAEIRRQISRVGLASKDEVDRLRQRVQALEVSQRKSRQTRTTARVAKPVKRVAKPVKKVTRKSPQRSRRKPSSAR